MKTRIATRILCYQIKLLIRINNTKALFIRHAPEKISSESSNISSTPHFKFNLFNHALIQSIALNPLQFIKFM
jgi:hypothetical protein